MAEPPNLAMNLEPPNPESITTTKLGLDYNNVYFEKQITTMFSKAKKEKKKKKRFFPKPNLNGS